MNNELRKFSKWHPLADHAELDTALDSPGIYVLIDKKNLKANSRVSVNHPLLYIGETCSRTLRKRLQEFCKAGFEKQKNHSGGMTFKSLFSKKLAASQVYVSVLAVNKKEPQASAYIRSLERLMIWEYVCIHDALPKCNSK